ncbi:amidohydrolase [Polaromonas sp. CG_9.5]|uniref:M20 metallopeptidase family protein n=1 Tax=Polaromonas sp. CG_9.5 TaxID=3071705 RepID=UPI002E024A2A|nr:amidohydrolase [Polaromonas sp. CG_9.5]
MTESVADISRRYQSYMVELRRKIHSHPELSFEEQSTSKLVQDELNRLGIPFELAGNYGIVATIEGKNPHQMVALRADMDALPIHEDNAHLPYCSKNPGVMHACGHDGHVAMLLGAAQVFQHVKDTMNGTVKLCFQQAEERGGGTAEILKLLAPFPVKSAFAIHLWSEIESGKFSVQAGPRMAAGDNFEVVIQGVGCHGATPHRGVDPIVVASAIVMNVSHLIAREIDPTHAAALTFGKLHSGEAGNVIPDKAVLAGTLRTTDKADQAHLQAALRRVVQSTADAFRATAEVSIKRGGPMLFNEARCSQLAEQTVQDLFGASDLIAFPPLMVSENFGDFLDVYPGLMAFIGVRNESRGACFAHHHPRFNIDEDTLYRGAALHVGYVLKCFESL